MGQAKQRGGKELRVEQSIAKKEFLELWREAIHEDYRRSNKVIDTAMAPPRVRHTRQVNVGTIGHIDHRGTTLVRSALAALAVSTLV